MPVTFPREQFELLALEAHARFQWARDDGEKVPEGLAFMAKDRVIGGHNRKGIETAAQSAFQTLRDTFDHATNPNPRISNRVVMVTAARKDGTPTQPSTWLKQSLLKIAGHPVDILVLASEGKKSLTVRVSAAETSQPKEPQ